MAARDAGNGVLTPPYGLRHSADLAPIDGISRPSASGFRCHYYLCVNREHYRLSTGYFVAIPANVEKTRVEKMVFDKD